MNDSDYYIPQEFVEGFAHEVKSKPKKGPAVPSPDDDSDGDGDDDGLAQSNTEGDPTDGQSIDVPDNAAAQQQGLREKALDDCVKNWKSAADDDSKRMWAIFDESGVFMSACRHGFILWIIDMIRSGELCVF